MTEQLSISVPTGALPEAKSEPSRQEKRKRHWSQQTIVAILAVALFAGFSVFVPGFLSAGNMVGLLQSVATLGLLGLGMGMIVIARGIDLSMIATLAVPPALILQLMGNGSSLGMAFVLAMALALAFGALNGLLIAYAEMAPLFATLSSGLLLYGLGGGVFFSSDIVPWPGVLDEWSWVGRSSVLDVPTPVLVFALAAVGIWIFLKRTRLGRFTYAMGDNPQGAKVAGIATRPMTVLLYVISALIGFVAGVVMAATLHAMPIRIYSSTMIYDVILVVVLGGIGLSGGRGGASSVLIGTLLIGALLNAMTLMDTSYSMQNLVKGALLLLAIIVDSRLNPRNEETAQQGDI